MFHAGETEGEGGTFSKIFGVKGLLLASLLTSALFVALVGAALAQL